MNVESVKEEFVPQKWDRRKALRELGIREIPFDEKEVHGYAYPLSGEISVSEKSPYPMKTFFHEVAHCLLHASEKVATIDDGYLTEQVKEAEAEAVAYLCCAALNLPGLEDSRRRVREALRTPEERLAFLQISGPKVIAATNAILMAGRP